MKVLLIRSNPLDLKNTRLPASLSDEVGPVMPLGLAYIAAYLRKQSIDVGMLDADVEKLSNQDIKERIAEFKPDLVGLTSMTATIHNDFEVAHIAQELGSKVVIGGPQVNAMPIETVQHPDIDFGIVGEGEYPIFKLVEALKQNDGFDHVPGLVYKDSDHKIICKAAYINDNLDKLPIPARDMLPYKQYNSLITKGRLANICPGRGCPFQCGFCFKQPSDKKVRYRSAKLVVDEIQEVINKYGVKEINFVTDTLTLNKKFVEEFCHEVIQRGLNISWVAPTRVDCVDLELLKLMKKAGCRSLRFGVESGSPKISKLMKKNTTNAKVLQVFKWAKEAKIETFAYLIIGYLYETEETVNETLAFVKKLKPDMLMYNVAVPLPKTLLFQQAVEADLVEKEYWQKYLIKKDHPPIPKLFNETDKWTRKAYKDFFFSPRFVLKKIFEIRPNNIFNYFKALKGLLGLRS